MSEPLVTVEGVSKKFCKTLNRSMLYGMQDIGRTMLGLPSKTHKIRTGEFWAIDNLDFELRRGECLGLIGRNGSGKSTLLKIINGIFSPDKGRVEIEGRVGAIIEIGAGFHPILTGRENIYINGSILGFSKKEVDNKFDKIVEFAEIGEFIDTPMKFYSSGMRVRLGFAIAAQIEPDIILIDEVLAVGDVGFRVKCVNRIKELIPKSAVIFVTHTMPQVSNICTRVIILDNGKAVYNDNDVAGGIDHYLSKFSLPDQNISGSGKAAVSDVRICNGRETASGKELLLLNHGDDLSIEMSLTVNSSIKEVGMSIWIENQEMRPVGDCFSQFCGFDIRPTRHSKIKLKLRNLQLNMGIYSIGIGVMNLVTKEALCRNAHCARLQVTTTYTSWASFLLSGEWEQKEV